MDEKFQHRIQEIKLLLAMSGFEDFYDDEEIERIARLPIDSIVDMCKHSFKGS
jgi:hypothetical protein